MGVSAGHLQEKLAETKEYPQWAGSLPSLHRSLALLSTLQIPDPIPWPRWVSFYLIMYNVKHENALHGCHLFFLMVKKSNNNLVHEIIMFKMILLLTKQWHTCLQIYLFHLYTGLTQTSLVKTSPHWSSMGKLYEKNIQLGFFTLKISQKYWPRLKHYSNKQSQ